MAVCKVSIGVRFCDGKRQGKCPARASIIRHTGDLGIRCNAALSLVASPTSSASQDLSSSHTNTVDLISKDSKQTPTYGSVLGRLPALTSKQRKQNWFFPANDARDVFLVSVCHGSCAARHLHNPNASSTAAPPRCSYPCLYRYLRVMENTLLHPPNLASLPIRYGAPRSLAAFLTTQPFVAAVAVRSTFRKEGAAPDAQPRSCLVLLTLFSSPHLRNPRGP